MPVVSIGIPMPGIPSVTPDGAEGLSRLVEHLIMSHGGGRLAFIDGVPGNPEVVARYRAYQRTLQQYGVEPNPALLEVGYFELPGESDSLLRTFEAIIAEAPSDISRVLMLDRANPANTSTPS